MIGIPAITVMSEVQRKPIEWLWPGRIAAGRITLIGGDPGLGKSWLTLDIAARVSTGRDWPDGSSCEAGNVLLMSCEDDLADTILPRLQLLGAETRNIYSLDGIRTESPIEGLEHVVTPITLADHETIAASISVTKAKLLIIDPITGFLGQAADSNRDTFIRGAFRPISLAAERLNCAVILVAHLNKSSEQAALYRFSGSVQYTGAARAAFYVGRDRGDESRRIMCCVKNNIGRDGWGLAYRLDQDSEHPLQWEPDELEDPRDLITGASESEDSREAAEWLKSEVTSPRGVSIKQIRKDSGDAGWNWQQVLRGARIAGLRRERIDGVWYFVPSDADPQLGRGWKEIEGLDDDLSY